MVGDAPAYTVTTETAGKSSEGNSSCLSVGITKAPMSKMAIVANAMRLRFLRLSLARNDITNSSIGSVNLSPEMDSRTYSSFSKSGLDKDTFHVRSPDPCKEHV